MLVFLLAVSKPHSHGQTPNAWGLTAFPSSLRPPAASERPQPPSNPTNHPPGPSTAGSPSPQHGSTLLLPEGAEKQLSARSWPR